MDINKLVARLQSLDDAYQLGKPKASDDEYNQLMAELLEAVPDHPLASKISAMDIQGQIVTHNVPMLSTDKAYTQPELTAWANKVAKVMDAHDIQDRIICVTPKLDGMAGKWYGDMLVTRGRDGLTGTNITSSLDKGLVLLGNRDNTSVGEIVVKHDYFRDKLSGEYEHPRNFVVGAISKAIPEGAAAEAFRRGMLRYVPFTSLDVTTVTLDEVRAWDDAKYAHIEGNCIYETDGLVLQVRDVGVMTEMGCTSHHPRYSIAKKIVRDTAVTTVTDILYQVGRTGRITPVVVIEPVKLSNATIDRATCHNVGRLLDWNIGINARVRIVRAGEVIPKVIAVTEPGDKAVMPKGCPNCQGPVAIEGPLLICTNEQCSSRVGASIYHFFDTMNNCDGFGQVTIDKLVTAGYDTVKRIYTMSLLDFRDVGFGEGEAANLHRELGESITTSVHDYRFIASFGIHSLGKSSSKKILTKYPLSTWDTLTASDISSISGFGKITGPSIAGEVERRLEDIRDVLKLGFTLLLTQPETEVTKGPLNGYVLMFTGGFNKSRVALSKEAKLLGAKVTTSLSGKVTHLVVGRKPGDSKIRKVRTLKNTQLMPIEEYLELIA